ncbi:MAG: SdrD B-like domain-containing protein [Ferruginibacter sp.]
MKQTSTITSGTFKKYLVIILTILSFSISQFVYAHSVDSYSGTCASGPQYKVTAVVSNVNNTSNYRWQWKNGSTWVCFVNGANTINGTSYNVSGAVYNLTTTPGPIIFTNPGSGLQGLEIRMVISDGNGVNPCNLPNGNTWTSTTNHFINVANTPCAPCTGRVTSLYFNKLDGGTDLPIVNGATFTIAQLNSLYNLEVATSGTIGSVKFTITGPTPTTVIENSAPYNSPGTGSGAWTGNVGTYTVNLKTYSGSGATGNLCHDTTITFILTNTLTLGNKVWYDTNNNGINDAAENGIRNISVNLYRDVNNDNVADGASIASTTTDVNGNYSFTGLTAGNYIVGVVVPNGYMSSAVNGGDPDNNTDMDDNGQVVSGNEIRGLGITLVAGAEPTGGYTNNTYDFGLLPDCSCTTSSNNLLVNGSFENGTTGWSWSGGTLTTGTGYVACGSANGFNNQSTGTGKVWQDVAVSAGATVTFKGFAGTHTAGISCSPTLSLIFLNASNTVLGQSNVTVTRDVDINNSQLEQYAITAIAPAGATKVRVQSAINCNTMKIDAFCLTTSTPNCPGAGTWNLSLPNGPMGTSHAYTVNGVTVTAYGFTNAGAATALYGKNAGGNETGLGIASNSDFEIDNTHFVQLDLNQVIASGATSGTMTIGSMQAGEPSSVYGSNTLGTRGTLLMTVPVSLDNTPFPIPGLPTYRYISVQASTPNPANVLLQQVSFSCPSNPGSIGDRVWEDLNRNGVQDGTEPGIAGVTVNLYNSSNAVIGTTTTNASGNYIFNNLTTSVAGTDYQVEFIKPAAYLAFSANNGAVTVADNSDANIATGRTTNVTLTNAVPAVTYVDAGMYKQINLSGNVWHDVNGLSDNLVNDTRGPSDAPIPTGMKMILVDANTSLVVRTTLIQGNGAFSFQNILPGTYILVLKIENSNIADPSPFASTPDGWFNTGEHLGLNPGSDLVNNGKLTVSVTTVSVTNANFGLNFGGDFPIN